MNRATANALLKALEEPIATRCLYWFQANRHRLLPTIRSRCQAIPVRARPCPCGRWLNDAGVRDAEDWLALAGGSPLLALELSASGERVLLDSLLAQLSRGTGLDALAAAAISTRQVKAEKRPAPLKRYARLAAEVAVRSDPGQPGAAAALLFAARAAAAAPGTRRPIPASSWHSIERRYNTRPSASNH
jgi:hypothetical protein